MQSTKNSPLSNPAIWHIAPRRYSLVNALIIFVAIFLSLIILHGFGLDLMGVPIHPWLVLALVTTELGAGIFFARTRNLISIQIDPSEFFGFALLVLATTAYSIYPSLPSLVPPTHHYDAVHHVALPTFIADTLTLPHDFSGATRPYYPPGYPVGAALATAMVAQWLGTLPIQTVHPFISFILGLTAGLIFCFILRLLPNKPIAFFVTLLLFTAWDYFPGAINDRFFSAQVFAQFFALLIFMVVLDNWQAPDIFSLLQMLLFFIAALFSHPSPLIAPMLAIAAIMTWQFLHAPRRALAHAGIFVLGLGAVGGLYVLPRLRAWVSQTGYGEATALTWESIGLVLPVLGILGFAFAIRRAWRNQFAIIFLLVCGILVQPIVLFIGRFIIPGIGAYYFDKSIYMLVYPLAFFAALALAQFTSRLKLVQPALWFFALAALPIIFITYPPRPFAPITLNEIQAAQWAKQNLDPDDVDVVSPVAEGAFWLHWLFLDHAPSSPVGIRAYNIGSMTFDEWRTNPDKPDYAIVRNLTKISISPETKVIQQFGNAGILYKMPSQPKPLAPPGHPTVFQFGDLFNLIGYDAPGTTSLDSAFQITFHWRPQNWATDHMRMFVQILDSSEKVIARAEREILQDKFPTQHWPLGQTITDTWQIQLPANTLPGYYTVEIAILDKAGARLTVYPSTEPADAVRLESFIFALPVITAEQFIQTNSANARFENGIILQNFAITPHVVAPGASILTTLYWSTVKPMNDDYTVFVHLLDSENHLVAQRDAQPQNGIYPTHTWKPGELIPDRYLLNLPKDLPPGTFQLEVGLYGVTDQRRVKIGGDDRILLPQTIQVR